MAYSYKWVNDVKSPDPCRGEIAPFKTGFWGPPCRIERRERFSAILLLTCPLWDGEFRVFM